MATIVVAGAITTIIATLARRSASAEAFTRSNTNLIAEPKAPMAVAGENNVYIVWWTNKSGNWEVMFRASNDGGQTFSDKMNLSNTNNADSWRVEIAAEGADVVVTWWETNQTSDSPVARISADGGQMFGPVLRLASNGTISSTETTTTAAGEEEEAE